VGNNQCSCCTEKSIAWQRIIRLSAYNEPVADGIVAMKFSSDWTWSPWFDRKFAEQIDTRNSSDHTIVCPVPMHVLRRAHLWFQSIPTYGHGIRGQEQMASGQSASSPTLHPPPNQHLNQKTI